MTQQETTQKITKIVAELLEKDAATLEPAAPLKELGVGEFDMIELVMKLEDQFGVLIEDADVSEITSIDSAVQFIAAKKTDK